MILVIVGSLIFLLGALQIRFPTLAEALKETDLETWKRLGAPSGYSFVDLGGTISLYSWILSKRFRSSSSRMVIDEGEKALSRALLAKYEMLAGLSIMILGFVVVLVQVIA
ncbi:hypothetical protein SAMN04487965_3284 [Microbulbifer donghaiensis]|uniref:Uncharacterized protein n=1 Tax=Microbulbifer donghaiensis TaxID=494016 RepID=A0A1M5GX21_9GAMM|nr:hypothetical protein [Microbulbifer donghaiensis]SHG08279.1 hypothetical protein SAMN04487965_3284 [Microbulbifer donghaiensis]